MESWYALKTKPSREFVVRDQLVARGVETYLPLWRPSQMNNAHGKLRPYFPSYLFASVDLEETSISSLVYMPGVNHILMCDDKPVRIEQHVIDAIAVRLHHLENSVTDATGKALAHGDRVTIISGVFAGYNAIFDQRISSEDRVRVLIDFLQKRTPLNIERNLIQKQNTANLARQIVLRRS